MYRPYFSKVAIFLCAIFLLACKRDKGIEGSWDLKEVMYLESKDVVPGEQLKGISFYFKNDGRFEQTGQNGEVLRGKYKLSGDSLFLVDTTTNMSYLYKYKLDDSKHLTFVTFEAFRNEEMQWSLERGKDRRK